MPHHVEFRREALPPLAALEREWRALEAAGRPSFFTSWQWIGTLLAAVPPGQQPQLLRGSTDGQTVALALLGANDSRRRHGLVRSRALYLNETGDAHFDSLMIERSFDGGATQLLRASVGNRVIGYLYNFRLGNRIYTYQSGFDNADRRERPGIVTDAAGDPARLPIGRACV